MAHSLKSNCLVKQIAQYQRHFFFTFCFLCSFSFGVFYSFSKQGFMSFASKTVSYSICMQSVLQVHLVVQQPTNQMRQVKCTAIKFSDLLPCGTCFQCFQIELNDLKTNKGNTLIRITQSMCNISSITMVCKPQADCVMVQFPQQSCLMMAISGSGYNKQQTG